jgi:amino acid adenylation domain-containing protein
MRFVDLAPELPYVPRPHPAGEQILDTWSTALNGTIWAGVRRRADECGVPIEALLRVAFGEVLGRWTRSKDPDRATTFLDRARAAHHGMRSSRASASESVANDATVVVSDIVLEGEPEPAIDALGAFHHEARCDREGLVLRVRALRDTLPHPVVGEMLETEKNLLTQLADRGLAWVPRAQDLLPPSALAARAAANATQRPVSQALLHSGFLARAAVRPRDPALIAEGLVLTYAELDARSNQVAQELLRRGARRGQPIAVVMKKGWEQVVAVLGILRAGAPYLPVDAELPAERVRYLLENGEVDLAVTQPGLETTDWPSSVRHRVTVDREPRHEPGTAGSAPPEETSLDDLAYVIYTSGSTGRPKGVMISHRGAVNTIADLNERFALRESDRVLGVSSLSFDLSVYDIFGTLAAGGALVLPKPGQSLNPRHWGNLIAREGVTVWNSVPALMELLVQDVAHRHAALPPSLRLVLLSGDWIPIGLPNRIRALGKGIRVISLGGATEASIWSILYPVEDVPPQWRSIPYGRPLGNQRFHVLDRALEPCPTWVPGDLFIAGTGLAQGYWRDEAKTRASFFVHPETGERLYRTGDLGRYMLDGDIEFLGREDSQVKINGFRIELGEIEVTLAQFAGLREVRVVAREQRELQEGAPQGPGRREKLIIAYYVDGHSPAAAEELRRFAASKLPHYMVPHSFISVDEMPLTPNGKLDVTRLPPPGPSSQGGRIVAAPRG